MTYTPTTSSILFLTICSVHKKEGGAPGYCEDDAIFSILPHQFKTDFLKRREEVQKLVVTSMGVKWQGIAVSDLSANEDLVQGLDFGGKQRAAYYPALDRYEGRFVLSLKEEGKLKLIISAHHTIFLSGLYGMLWPHESIQNYSCPLDQRVIDIWRRDNLPYTSKSIKFNDSRDRLFFQSLPIT